MNAATVMIDEAIKDHKTSIAEARRTIENLEKQLPGWRAIVAKNERAIVELKASRNRIEKDEMENTE